MALDILCRLPVRAQNAGLFISRGVGTHPARVLPSHEIIFVDSGTLSIWEEDRQFDIGPGESLLLLPGRRHGGASDYPRRLRFYWIHFDVLGAQDVSEQGAGAAGVRVHLPQHAEVARADRLTELFRMFLDDQEAGGLGQTRADLLLCLMLAEIAGPRSAPAGRGLRSEAVASKAMEHIKTHFHGNLTTIMISEAIDINPDYLERIFKKAYGRTITQAIHDVRIRYARRLILDQVGNIDQIATQSGYTDPGYFRRVFKKHLGMTPKAFKRLHARVHVNTG